MCRVNRIAVQSRQYTGAELASLLRYAKQDHTEASPPGKTRRTGPVDAGWRIRARRDRARSRRQARCTLDQAGDRHRTFKGQTSRGQSSAARTREDIGANASSGPTGVAAGSSRKKTSDIFKALPGHAPRPQTRGARCGIDSATVPAGADRGTKAFGSITKRFRATRCTDEGRHAAAIGC